MPRLKKGEMATSIKQKSLDRASSVQARIDVLMALLREDLPTKQYLVPLATLGSLCEWNCPEHSITPIDRKTFKLHVNKLYAGGAEAFARDMKIVVNRPERGEKPKGASQDAHGERASAVLELVQRYDDLLEKVNQVARSSDEVRKALVRHLRKFGDMPSHLRIVAGDRDKK